MTGRLATALFACLALVACATDTSGLRRERTYVVEWIGERPLIDSSHLTLTFGNDGRAFGSGGCNRWFARYTLEGGRLGFSDPGSTRKACAPALMEQERRFLAALPGVVRWDLSEQGQLQLWPAHGQPIRLWPED